MSNIISIKSKTRKSISEHLIESGVVKSIQAANATELFYIRWVKNKDCLDIKRERERTQYYIHKKRLEKIGLNIDDLKTEQKIININKQMKEKIENIEEIKKLATKILDPEKRKMIYHTAEYLQKLIRELES